VDNRPGLLFWPCIELREERFLGRPSNLLLIVIGLAGIVALWLYGIALHSGHQALGGLIYVIDGLATVVVIALLVWLVVRKR
jgi:hypothetical protein